MTDKPKRSKLKTTLLSIGAVFAFFTIVGALTSSSPGKEQPVNIQQASHSTQGVKGDSTTATRQSKVETKTEDVTVAIPYQSSTQDDPSLAQDTTIVATTGINGEKIVTYKVTYTNGVETSREQVSERISKQPINEVKRTGTKVATPAPLPNSNSGESSCSGGYINSVGDCIPSPGSNPAGASARCRDGTYSYSQSRSGTCSHHGGVAEWL